MRVTPTTCRWPAATLAAALWPRPPPPRPSRTSGDPFDLAHPAVRGILRPRRAAAEHGPRHREGRARLSLGGDTGRRRPLERARVADDRHAGSRRLELHPRARRDARLRRSGSAARPAASCGCGATRQSLVPRREAFTLFGAAQGLPALRVTEVFEASDGTIWAATAGGAARLVGERFHDVSDGLADRAAVGDPEIEDDARPQADARGRRGGAVDARGRALVPVDLGPQRFVGSVNSLLQTKDRDGVRTLWVGTYGSGVLRIRHGRVDRFGPAEGLSQPAGHVARSHAARTGERAALGGHARRRPVPSRRRALPGRAARPVDLRGVLAARRRRGGPGRALGRHAHGRPAPPRGRLVAGARPLFGTAGRPGAGPAGDEGRRPGSPSTG